MLVNSDEPVESFLGLEWTPEFFCMPLEFRQEEGNACYVIHQAHLSFLHACDREKRLDQMPRGVSSTYALQVHEHGSSRLRRRDPKFNNPRRARVQARQAKWNE
jgi:hypothetical protein